MSTVGTNRDKRLVSGLDGKKGFDMAKVQDTLEENCLYEMQHRQISTYKTNEKKTKYFKINKHLRISPKKIHIAMRRAYLFSVFGLLSGK